MFPQKITLGWAAFLGCALLSVSAQPSGYWDTRFTLNTADFPSRMTFDPEGRILAVGEAPFVFPSVPASVVWWDGRSWSRLTTNRLVGATSASLARGSGFTVLGGIPRTNLVSRLDGDTAVELAEAVDGRIDAVVVFDSDIIVGGQFTTASGATNLARWNGSQWTPLGLGIATRVTHLLSANGYLYAATPGASEDASATVWRWDGAAWTALGQISSGGTPITALCWYDGSVTISANLGAEADSVKHWRDQQWQPLSGGPLRGSVAGLAVRGDELWATGQLRIAYPSGEQAAALARRRGGQWEAQLREEITRGRLIESDGERLLLKADLDPKSNYTSVAGLWHFEAGTWRLMINGLRDAPSTTAAVIAPDGIVVTTEATDRNLRGSFLWDGTRCRPLPTPPGAAGEVLRMRAGLASFGGVVYGAASYPSGPAPHVLLRRTVGAWEQFTQGTSVEPQVIAADGLQIFVAGRTQDPALRPNGVMKWNGHEWSPAGGPFERPIATLGLWNGQFIVGGSFTNAGPFKTAWLARWAESYWEPVGPALNGEVRSLHAFKGELYVAGNFSRAGDLDVPGLAIWNGTAWRTLPAPAEMANLSAVAVSPDGVVGVATATSRQRIWLWRADSWTLISDNPTLVPSPKLLWRGHDLHVTGGFVELGGIVSDVYGIWHEPGPWLRMDPRSPTDLALGVTGALPLRYEIQRSTDLRNWSKWATNSLLAQEQSFSVGDELSEPGASFRLISKD